MFGTPNEQGLVQLYIVFNVHLFLSGFQNFYTKLKHDPQNFVDLERGTVDLNFENSKIRINPSAYFKQMTMWNLLFASVCHAMAHIDSYEKNDSAFYSNHDRLTKSPFYRLILHGQKKIKNAYAPCSLWFIYILHFHSRLQIAT